MSRLKVQWRELSLSKAYKLLQGDPVVLLTAAWKGRNDVMTRSMKTWFVVSRTGPVWHFGRRTDHIARTSCCSLSFWPKQAPDEPATDQSGKRLVASGSG